MARVEIPAGPALASWLRAVSLMSSIVSCLRRSRRFIISIPEFEKPQVFAHLLRNRSSERLIATSTALLWSLVAPRDHTDIRRTGRPAMEAPIVSRDPRSPRCGPLSGFGRDEGPA